MFNHRCRLIRAQFARNHGVTIHCDNGPEYISEMLTTWANTKGITLMYIQPDKPTQNAYVKRCNHTVRHEWLHMHQFESIEQAQQLATEWQWQYNNEPPKSAIGGVPPTWLLKLV